MATTFYFTPYHLMKNYELWVIEDSTSPKGVKGVTQLMLDESQGNACSCVATYRELSTSGLYPNAQWFLKQNGYIVAISVHDNLLWLENVPPPKYFFPPKVKKQELFLPAPLEDEPKRPIGFGACI